MGESRTISTIVGPLNFSESSELSPHIQKKEIACLSCSKTFNYPNDKDLYLAHLFLEHKIVISDERQIAFLDEYLIFWREKFQGK